MRCEGEGEDLLFEICNGTVNLLHTHSACRMSNLSMKIRHFYFIRICETESANSCAGEICCCRTAKATRADEENFCFANALLAYFC